MGVGIRDFEASIGIDTAHLFAILENIGILHGQ